MEHNKQLDGAIRLVTKFDTMEDDNTIDKIICHAIESGLNIDDYYDELLIAEVY